MALRHFFEQEKHTRNYLLPYFNKHIPHLAGCQVLEIGCAEGGFLQVLTQVGLDARGLELSAGRVATALQYAPRIQIKVGDITDPEIPKLIGTQFDLIVLRDVMEHIPTREITFRNLNELLKKSGYLYITFPPKFSAYGGHQQNARSLIKFIPFFHLLPEAVIRKAGSFLRENPLAMEQILKTYKNGLSIHEFENLCTAYRFSIKVKELFFSRPVFKTRYGLPMIRFPNLPYFREFLASGCEYLLQKI
jgi:SAM-dependent methyltransferase